MWGMKARCWTTRFFAPGVGINGLVQPVPTFRSRSVKCSRLLISLRRRSSADRWNRELSFRLSRSGISQLRHCICHPFCNIARAQLPSQLFVIRANAGLNPDIVHQPERRLADGVRRHFVLEQLGNDFLAENDIDEPK